MNTNTVTVLPTFYHSRPIDLEDLPLNKEGGSLDDRITTITGNFFHHRLSIFLQLMEKWHAVKVKKCSIKGSIVPILIQLSPEPPEGINDIDLQITFVKKGNDQKQLLDHSSTDIDSKTITAIYNLTLACLQPNKAKTARPPLCRPDLGYFNVQVQNLSTVRSFPIDLTMKFENANFMKNEPDAISTKDGLEINIKYSENGPSFELSQSPFITQFSSLANSMGLYWQRLFTVPPEYIAQIRNGLLILFRYEMKDWIYVKKSFPDNPDSDLYEKGDMDSLLRTSFLQFLEQNKNSLDNMHLAQLLRNFINNHMAENGIQASLLLEKLLSLNLKYSKDPKADLEIASMILLNISMCQQHCIPLLSSNPNIARFKEKLGHARQHLELMKKKQQNQNIVESNSIPLIDNNPLDKKLDHASANPEMGLENKNEDNEVKTVFSSSQNLAEKNPLSAAAALKMFVKQAPHQLEGSHKSAVEKLIHLLYKAFEDDCTKRFKINLETFVNDYLMKLQNSKEKEEQAQAIELAAAFINFINHHNDLKAPEIRSKSSKLVSDHILNSLSHTSGKKGKQLIKINALYQSLTKASNTNFLEAICDGFSQLHSSMSERKSLLLLKWIASQQNELTIPMLHTAAETLNFMSEITREIFEKKITLKLTDSKAKALWNQLCLPELTLPSQLPPNQSSNPSSKPKTPAIERNPYDSKDLELFHAVIRHIKKIILDEKWIKALQTLNDVESRLENAKIKNQDRKNIQSVVNKYKRTIRDKFSNELESKEFSHPHEIFPLYENYCNANGDDLNFTTYFMLAGQSVVRGKYPLNVYFIFKGLKEIFHQFHMNSYKNNRELHHILKNAEEMLQVVNQTIQQSHAWPDHVKNCVDSLCQSFSDNHFQLIAGKKVGSFDMDTALERLTTTVFPIGDYPIRNTEEHKSLLLKLANLHENLESKTLHIPFKRMTITLLKGALEIDCSESILLYLLMIHNSFPPNCIDKGIKCSKAIIDAYERFYLHHDIIEIHSPYLHYSLSYALVQDSDFNNLEKTKLNLIRACLHSAMAIKRNVEDSILPQSVVLEIKCKFDSLIPYLLTNVIGSSRRIYENLSKEINQIFDAIKNDTLHLLPPQSYDEIHSIEVQVRFIPYSLRPLVPNVNDQYGVDEKEKMLIPTTHEASILKKCNLTPLKYTDIGLLPNLQRLFLQTYGLMKAGKWKPALRLLPEIEVKAYDPSLNKQEQAELATSFLLTFNEYLFPKA